MEIKYTNNRENYVEGYDYYRKVSVKFKTLKLILYLIGIIIIDFTYKYELSSFYNIGLMAYLETVIIISIATIIFIFIINNKSKKSIEKLINKCTELGTITMEEETIEIVKDKLILKGKSHHRELNMKAFDKVCEKDNVIIICIEKYTPSVIIPKNAFDSEDMKNEFINLIKEKSDYIK